MLRVHKEPRGRLKRGLRYLKDAKGGVKGAFSRYAEYRAIRYIKMELCGVTTVHQ
jgi:hypothetical protein